MTKGDKIYCFTCGKISFDDSPVPNFVNPDTKPCSKSRQDSRFNPKWNYRCPHCYGFKTINASQFLEEGKSEAYVVIDTGDNRESLKAHGRQLKQDGIIKGFRVKSVSKGRFRLYERRYIKKYVIKALKKWDRTKALNTMNDTL